MRPAKQEHYLGTDPNDHCKEVFIVIRSAGEATEQLCYALLHDQVGEGNVKLIKEKPFTEAVRKTFTLGLEANKKWTLAIDADILVRKNAVMDLVKWANGFEDYFFEFQGRVVDKFFCAPRPGGPHLYRTRYLEQAIDFLPKDKGALRPESYTYQKMAEIGYHYFHHPEVYGIHDYFQFHKDIYRKAFLHAHKHRQHVGYFVKQWSKLKEKNIDYQIALQGLLDGLSFDKEVEVNIDFFKTQIDKNLVEGNGYEYIDPEGDLHIIIDDIINSWDKDEDALTFEKKHLALHRRSDANKNDHNKLLLSLGEFTCKVGNYLKHLAKK